MSAVIQFLNVLVIAKFLGPEGNGVYSMALIVSLTLGLFLNLGLGQANAYYVGRKEFPISQVVALSQRLFLVYLLVFVLVMASVDDWFIKFLGVPCGYLYILTICVPVVILNSWLLGVLQGKENFAAYNTAMVVSPVVSFCFTLLLVFLDSSSGVFYYFGWFLGNFFSTAYLVLVVNAYLKVVKGEGRQANYFVRALTYGWKAHVSNLSSYAMYRVDIYLLNYFYSSSVVGVYSVAQQVIERFWMIAQAVSTVLFPKLASLTGVESKKTKVDLTIFSAKWVFLSSIVCGVFVYFLVEYFIEIIFGAEYSQAALAIQILLPGMIFFNLSRVFASYTSSSGFVGYMAIVSLLCLAVSIFINVFLTPLYGIQGAALATSISYSASFCLGFTVFMKISR